MSLPLLHEQDDQLLTVEEYLRLEETSGVKHEYLNGTVYAMSGGSRAHCRIARNVVNELDRQLVGSGCEALPLDMRVRIRRAESTFYYYPDVVVDCSGSDADEVEEPTVIFEVLSESTSRADRGEKLLNYQLIPSLKVYAMVSQHKRAITVYRRRESVWAMEQLGPGSSTLELPEIGCSVSLDAIYHNVF